VHRARLLGRDPDAAASDPHFEGYLAFNRWLRENGPATNPPMTLLDTTDATPKETTAAVAAWIRGELGRASERPSPSGGPSWDGPP
jgi:hypothetical protein